MKRFLVLLAVVMPFVLGMAILSCGDENYRHHPLNQDDGDFSANDMDENMSCDINNVVIESCYDACSCCFLGQEDNIAECVMDCDAVLDNMMDESVNPTRADFIAYKECTLGCVSLCDHGEENGACWNECKRYLDQ